MLALITHPACLAHENGPIAAEASRAVGVRRPLAVTVDGGDSFSYVPTSDAIAVLPGIVLALGVGGLTTFFLFVPEYSRELGMGSSGGLFLLYAVMSLVIRIFGATLPERLGPRRMVTVALLAFAIGLVAVAAIDAVWALWFAAALIGIGPE